jgi:hypothetical protein
MSTERTETSRAGWRPASWARETDLSRATVYNLMGRQEVESVKVGKARVITTSPAEFLARCPKA